MNGNSFYERKAIVPSPNVIEALEDETDAFVNLEDYEEMLKLGDSKGI